MKGLGVEGMWGKGRKESRITVRCRGWLSRGRAVSLMETNKLSGAVGKQS